MFANKGLLKCHLNQFQSQIYTSGNEKMIDFDAQGYA